MTHRRPLRKLWRRLIGGARHHRRGGHAAPGHGHGGHGHNHGHRHGAEEGGAIHCTALCCARSGQRVSIEGFSGEAMHAARLRDLGLREGVQITVLRDGDPLMVRVDEARFGIGRAAAMHVLCRVVE